MSSGASTAAGSGPGTPSVGGTQQERRSDKRKTQNKSRGGQDRSENSGKPDTKKFVGKEGSLGHFIYQMTSGNDASDQYTKTTEEIIRFTAIKLMCAMCLMRCRTACFQCSAVVLKFNQPLRCRGVAFVSYVVRRAGKVVNGGYGCAQMCGAQERRDGEVFVVGDGGRGSCRAVQGCLHGWILPAGSGLRVRRQGVSLNGLRCFKSSM